MHVGGELTRRRAMRSRRDNIIAVISGIVLSGTRNEYRALARYAYNALGRDVYARMWMTEAQSEKGSG